MIHFGSFMLGALIWPVGALLFFGVVWLIDRHS
jgi:hypothetical protein